MNAPNPQSLGITGFARFFGHAHLCKSPLFVHSYKKNAFRGCFVDSIVGVVYNTHIDKGCVFIENAESGVPCFHKFSKRVKITKTKLTRGNHR